MAGAVAARPRGHDLTGMHGAAFALLLCLAASATAAAPRDLAGWGEARWGMTGEALEERYGGALRELPARQVYGGAYADRMLPDVDIGGEPFTAFFQMTAATGRLQQVLLRWKRRQPSDRAFAAILAALRRRYGKEDLVCRQPKPGPGDLVVERIWRFPTTTVHFTLLDFYTTAIAFEDPHTDRDPGGAGDGRERNDPRFLPRAALIRFHPTEHAGLMGRGDCRGR